MTAQPVKETAYAQVEVLIKRFKRLSAIQRKAYNEDNTRKDFVLPLFKSLLWDVANAFEVAAEEKVSRGWVDFAFRIDGIPRLFLETKRIGEDLSKPQWIVQATNYAWTKGVPWALLSSFEELRVFNAEWREANPERGQFIQFDIDSYLADFDRLWWLSRPEVVAGTLNIEAENVGKRAKREPVTKLLFDDLRYWRTELFRHLIRYNKGRSPEEIDEAVLRILNRLIFIRTAEDREVDNTYLLPLVRELSERHHLEMLPERLAKLFRDFDGTYNSDLFALHYSEDLDCEPEPFRRMIEGLYEKRQHFTRYNFNAIDADVLGAVYEQYLGATATDELTQDPRQKRRKRKAQGIYYTPSFVVGLIVRQTLGRHLAEHGYVPGRHPRVLDMACGSGSFLIEAFDSVDRYVANMRSQSAGARDEFHDHARRTEILTSAIYGVDMDEQAVAVSKLNLCLRALFLRDKLPMLGNIRSGDSLVSGSPAKLRAVFRDDWRLIRPFDWGKEFPSVIEGGGFDVIIGNPPYFNVETMGKRQTM